MRTLLNALIPAALALILPAAADAQTLIIDDPLQGSTVGTQVGGSFSAEGYQPKSGQNHILYDLPQTVSEGYVQFEVKGMDHAVVPVDGDHGFFAMYDGRGIAEPIKYFDDFKQNFFRWNCHWRQNRAAMKCVISCAAPTPQRLNATKAVYSGTRDWSVEPTGKGVSWDPARWVAFKIEWKNRTFKVFIDGVEKWSASGPYDYAPVDHKAWLGCAPGQGKKYVCHVPNIVYRNFKLYSTSGGGSNLPPSAGSQTVSTPQDTAIPISLTYTDPDGPGPFSFTIVNPPSSGTLSGAGGSRIYTLTRGFTGTDSFTWRVNDGLADSNAATVTITVTSAGGGGGSGLVSNTSPSGYVWDTLGVGSVQYVDRTYTFTSVPLGLAGLDYLRTANGDKGLAGPGIVSFDVSQDVTVYVAHDDRITSKPGWMASFVDTGNDLVSGGGTFSLWAASFSAGRVGLGGNTDTGSTINSMYTVVVAPGATSPIDSDGDGMSDAAETQYGLDPLDPDQDSNGVPDGQDDWNGNGATNLADIANGIAPGTPPAGGPGPGPGSAASGEGENGCGATGAEIFLILAALGFFRQRRRP